MTDDRAIVPPATLGLIGGGQLGRMTALAARSAGYGVNAMDPDPQCAITPVSDNFILAGWDDTAAAQSLARSCDVVTFEIEKVSTEVLRAAAVLAPVRPGPAILEMVQNRLRQKSWLRNRGFPVGPFRAVSSVKELRDAVGEFGACFLKAAEGGYDGKGQARVQDAAQVETVWAAMSGRDSIVEKSLDIEYELSVLVARRPAGEVRVYPPAMNLHENQILRWSLLPGPIEERVVAEAQNLASEIAATLELEGLLTVEMFVTRDGRLLVNELAPRTHNSYHTSERACVTGQFEQLVRAICNLPLGSVEVVRPTAILNLLGDLWAVEAQPDVAASLLVPETRIHLYGKTPARRGRKMGHISATGATAKEALQRALRAREMLTAMDSALSSGDV